MSKKKKSTKPSHSWDLDSFFYKGLNDPAIEKDVQKIVRACEGFEKKYRNKKDYLANETKLKNALEEYERLTKKTSPKPLYYLSYKLALNSSDTEAEALMRKYSSTLTQASNKILFFDLKLGKIPIKKQRIFLKSKKLERYHYLLKVLFDTSRYDLSEPEEKILSLTSQTSRGMWIDGVEKLQNKQVVKYGKNTIPLSEAFNLIPQLPNNQRQKLHKESMRILKEHVSDFAESEMNAVYTSKKVSDELRGLKEPYSATILGYENKEQVVLDLVSAVTENFQLSQKFYSIKARLLKKDVLTLADRSASVGTTKREYTPQQGIKIVSEVFESVDPVFHRIFNNMLHNGQIDFFPKQHKTSGAFCSSGLGTPTLVLLNHDKSARAIETLAHEMGHAIHSELSKKQPVMYQDYSTSVAETASTFFEGLVFEKMFESMSDKEKIVALHDKISSDISTIQRQIAFFNFELDLHKAIREYGFVPKEDIAQLLNTHMSSYLGKSVALEEDDGYFFIYVSHFRRFFYVYSYAYGQLISQALRAEYKKNPDFIKGIKFFLSAGGSMAPEDIFKHIGVTINKSFFEKGLEEMKRDIEMLDKLTKK